ncbi:hypothetical protein [Mycoplasma nasistruthionis]|uniref:Uncharacterized protein n=1 Tax=Mycoplasma nasistruthionis TaxID=353852 RepID=A0A4Y6I8E1_9MOLU|nr:hypothetical protein [Mycoplasma nasistruthionis]QDF65178.1 hypothetical protein FIV53_02680 [Mycoplasma nasistruthionis]
MENANLIKKFLDTKRAYQLTHKKFFTNININDLKIQSFRNRDIIQQILNLLENAKQKSYVNLPWFIDKNCDLDKASIIAFPICILKWKENETSDNFVHSGFVYITFKKKRNQVKAYTLSNPKIHINQHLLEKLKDNYNIQINDKMFENFQKEPNMTNLKKLWSLLSNKIQKEYKKTEWTVNTYIAYLQLIKSNELYSLDLMVDNIDKLNFTLSNAFDFLNQKDQLSLNDYTFLQTNRQQLKLLSLAHSGKDIVLNSIAGVGKSYTLANITASLISKNKKVLILTKEHFSNNNSVLKHLEKLSNPFYLLLDKKLSDGKFENLNTSINKYNELIRKDYIDVFPAKNTELFTTLIYQTNIPYLDINYYQAVINYFNLIQTKTLTDYELYNDFFSSFKKPINDLHAFLSSNNFELFNFKSFKTLLDINKLKEVEKLLKELKQQWQSYLYIFNKKPFKTAFASLFELFNLWIHHKEVFSKTELSAIKDFDKEINIIQQLDEINKQFNIYENFDINMDFLKSNKPTQDTIKEWQEVLNNNQNFFKRLFSSKYKNVRSSILSFNRYTPKLNYNKLVEFFNNVLKPSVALIDKQRELLNSLTIKPPVPRSLKKYSSTLQIYQKINQIASDIGIKDLKEFSQSTNFSLINLKNLNELRDKNIIKNIDGIFSSEFLEIANLNSMIELLNTNFNKIHNFVSNNSYWLENSRLVDFAETCLKNKVKNNYFYKFCLIQYQQILADCLNQINQSTKNKITKISNKLANKTTIKPLYTSADLTKKINECYQASFPLLLSVENVEEYYEQIKDFEFDTLIIDDAEAFDLKDIALLASQTKQKIIFGNNDKNYENENNLLSLLLDKNKSKSTDLSWNYTSLNSNLLNPIRKLISSYENMNLLPNYGNKYKNLNIEWININATKSIDFINENNSSGINVQEATKIIEKINEIKNLHPNKSIGVFVFNEKQKNYLKQHIDVIFKDKDIFIKNYNNNFYNLYHIHKKDIPDIVIIGTTYGINWDYKLTQVHGPFYKDSKEPFALWHFATSLAKEKVIVFNSLNYSTAQRYSYIKNQRDLEKSSNYFETYLSKLQYDPNSLIHEYFVDVKLNISDFEKVIYDTLKQKLNPRFTLKYKAQSEKHPLNFAVFYNNCPVLGIAINEHTDFDFDLHNQMLKNKGWKILEIDILTWMNNYQQKIDEFIQILNNLDLSQFNNIQSNVIEINQNNADEELQFVQSDYEEIVYIQVYNHIKQANLKFANLNLKVLTQLPLDDSNHPKRVDIAIVEQKNDRYIPLLAIEVDGQTYHSSMIQKKKDEVKNQLINDVFGHDKIYRINTDNLKTKNSREKHFAELIDFINANVLS